MNPQILNDILNEETALEIARVLGIENEPTEVRTALLADLGTNITRRIALEIFKVLPQKVGDEFGALIGTDKLDEMHAIVSPYIKDLDAFVQKCARAEIDDTLAIMAQPAPKQYV